MDNFGALSNSTLSSDVEDFFEDDLLLEDEKARESSERKIKILKFVFIILCLFLVAEFVIYKYIMPSLESPHVTVAGCENFTAEEIAIKLLPMESRNWFDFDVKQSTAILSSEAGLESVSVEKRFPDRIYINIVERTPVAVTFVEDAGCSYPMQIDRNGVLFPVKNKASLNSNVIPIISGLSVEHLSGGMRIPAKYRPLIDQVNRISEIGKNYFASISEICVSDKETGSYELTLIPSQSKTKVLTDRSLNEESLKYMMVALDIVNSLDVDVDVVDLRYGSVSYKTR